MVVIVMRGEQSSAMIIGFSLLDKRNYDQSALFKLC